MEKRKLEQTTETMQNLKWHLGDLHFFYPKSSMKSLGLGVGVNVGGMDKCFK